MDISNVIAGITLRVGEHYLHVRVVHQQTDKLSAGIAGCSKDSYFYHIDSPFLF